MLSRIPRNFFQTQQCKPLNRDFLKYRKQVVHPVRSISDSFHTKEFLYPPYSRRGKSQNTFPIWVNISKLTKLQRKKGDERRKKGDERRKKGDERRKREKPLLFKFLSLGVKLIDLSINVVRNILPKTNPVHPCFASVRGINRFQHASMLNQMNKDAIRSSVRDFSRLTNGLKNPKVNSELNSLLRNKSPLVKQIVEGANKQQSRSQSYLALPQPKTDNEKAMYLGAGALLLIAAYFILDKTLNQVQVGDSQYISPAVRRYLSGVYAYLTAGVAITAASAVAAWRSGVVNRLAAQYPMAFLIASFAATVGTMYACRAVDPRNIALKNSLFVAFTVLEGISLSFVGAYGGAVVRKAGLYTFGIFLAMSTIAMTAKHERFLYMGGALYAGLATMIIASFASLGLSFFGRMPRTVAVLDAFLLWGGLALFVAFLLYHTQSVIAHGKQFASLEQSGKFSSSLSTRGTQVTPDYINEALRLYLDILNIFVRLVMIFGNSNRRK